MNVCETIEQITGEKVTPETRLDSLNVDSLEYIDLMLTLDVPPEADVQTVGDIIRMRS